MSKNIVRSAKCGFAAQALLYAETRAHPGILGTWRKASVFEHRRPKRLWRNG